MHRCWEVAELTNSIFEELDPYTDQCFGDPELRRINAVALYRLATTCRWLSESALDVLCRSNDGLISLFKCLPSRSWVISDGLLKITSPPVPEDWDRFLRYSSRIKMFLAHDFDIALDISALECLRAALPSGTVLPGVHSISCRTSSMLFAYLPFLIGPRLLKIWISHDGPDFRLSALPSFGFQSRTLKYVRVTSESFGDISPLISDIPSPHILELQFLNQRCYNQVAAFPNLRSLYIWNVEDMPFPSDSPLSSNAPFPALRDLKLSGTDISFLLNLLSSLKSPLLSVLHIRASSNSTSIMSTAVLNAVYKKCSVFQLTHLYLYLCEEKEYVAADPATYTLEFSLLTPLLAYRCLRQLALLTPLGFNLDDTAVDLISRAWPQIEDLYIAGEFTCNLEDVSYPTLAALISIARYCPSLRNLWLAVDASIAPPLCGTNVPHHALEVWHPCFSPIGDPEPVGQFLGSLFPSLAITDT
ncbi:hypothetical protein R3P38DRAFT_2665581 [Favolaschia claudopus]|uniref:Uncharacterized protein n=1 Tax=Favolaschia claudopus TaxID=2862362 RepID=A0AAV9ZDH4_9AGAR